MVDGLEPDDDVAARLRALPREMPPPSRVAASLARTLTRRQSATSKWRVTVAASLLVAAFLAGRFSADSRSAGPEGQTFAFLLYGGPSEAGDDRAAEYGAWARELARSGRRVSGERLADQSAVAGIAMPDVAPLRGFFIVEAASPAEAILLARSHPHARDGTIVVRAIDTP